MLLIQCPQCQRKTDIRIEQMAKVVFIPRIDECDQLTFKGTISLDGLDEWTWAECRTCGAFKRMTHFIREVEG